VTNLAELTAKFQAVWPLLDERSRRLMAAAEATSLGRGGISAVSRACGLSRRAITKGIEEIRAGVVLVPGRIRRPGAGRKAVGVTDPGLVDALSGLIADDPHGTPTSPLRWINKSTRTLAAALTLRVTHDPEYRLDGIGSGESPGF
jgi:hypothetical protein